MSRPFRNRAYDEAPRDVTKDNKEGCYISQNRIIMVEVGVDGDMVIVDRSLELAVWEL